MEAAAAGAGEALGVFAPAALGVAAPAALGVVALDPLLAGAAAGAGAGEEAGETDAACCRGRGDSDAEAACFCGRCGLACFRSQALTSTSSSYLLNLLHYFTAGSLCAYCRNLTRHSSTRSLVNTLRTSAG